MEWWRLTDKRKVEILNQTADREGLPTQAVEKDWWVTQCLRAIFSSKDGINLVFKGGTSLSKGWGLIERFSEDIDLSVSREFLGFGGNELSNSQIKKLRKASFAYVSDPFARTIETVLVEMGIPQDDFALTMGISSDSDVDPQSIYVSYQSLLTPIDYIPARVKIEVGARALMEPVESRSLQSLIGENFPVAPFSDSVFQATTVLPKRTFLEKIFLLHETQQWNPTGRGDRMSRHLYDVERLMDTSHGITAVEDRELFKTIAEFRRRFNTIKGVDYDRHTHSQIAFVPDNEHLTAWEIDYKELQNNMIFGESLPFSALISRLRALQDRFRAVPN